MLWRNPQVGEEDHVAASPSLRQQNTVRVACVQYQQRAIGSFDDFARQVEYFVDAVADYKADFVVFPELFHLQLLSIENKHTPAARAIAAPNDQTHHIPTSL